MNRAGQEPAEDVKRRLAAVCEEVGLTVARASMQLSAQAGARLIYVGASFADWLYETPTVSLMAVVSESGQWPEFVDVRCSATTRDPAQTLGPWMTGRNKVPFSELIEQLRATLAEREQVVAAGGRGIPGPYRFEQTVWEKIDPLQSTL
ncbi:hypothetical protein BH10PLA2_BH10PLA2_28740 [soil metagenome]